MRKTSSKIALGCSLRSSRGGLSTWCRTVSPLMAGKCLSLSSISCRPRSAESSKTMSRNVYRSTRKRKRGRLLIESGEMLRSNSRTSRNKGQGAPYRPLHLCKHRSQRFNSNLNSSRIFLFRSNLHIRMKLTLLLRIFPCRLTSLRVSLSSSST
jgi:hypothetical protein